jgi:ribonuclease E
MPAVKVVAEVEQNNGAEKLLEAVLDALPEPKAPGQGRKKPRRASSGGNVSAG